ncbi:STAS domain-containing protein [Streptomyces sp. NPDC018031]|uniref:STAS domain-containing protein n=1 Tax=Streptomyces sp. NPDC018031 TaxID=3365033 RepID=UPI0037B4C4EC
MADDHAAASSSRLSVDRSVVDGVGVVALHGQIDHSVRDHLNHALLPPGDACAPRTVVDLSGVTFMDSTGINVLLTAHLAATGARGWLRLAGPREPVLRVIQLVGIDTVIPCYPALRQALSN